LWKESDIAAISKGYPLCGPAGTGKTFMVGKLVWILASSRPELIEVDPN
jgi:predicted ATPase with chaperone activity